VRVLIDTHAFLWLHGEPRRLGRARSLLEEPETRMLVSAVVAWEIAIKVRLERLTLPEPLQVWMPTRMARAGAESVPVQQEHALAVADLPPLHGDPFDRLLVCQSLLLRVPIVTADRAIAQYDVEVVQAG
jgi:PIN domain nuclease of toxin-antitoxin system